MGFFIDLLGFLALVVLIGWTAKTFIKRKRKADRED